MGTQGKRSDYEVRGKDRSGTIWKNSLVGLLATLATAGIIAYFGRIESVRDESISIVGSFDNFTKQYILDKSEFRADISELQKQNTELRLRCERGITQLSDTKRRVARIEESRENDRR